MNKEDVKEYYSDYPQTKDGKHICTPNKPMPTNAKGRWAHTTVHEIGERYNGDVVVYECKDCKHTWEAELPQ